MDRFAQNELDPLNPYAAPAAPTGFTHPAANYEVIRQEHLNHEANIRAFGALYYLGSVVLSIGGAATMVSGAIRITDGGPDAAFLVIVGAIYFSIGIFQFFVARGLRRFTPVGRIGGSILGIIGLAGFPVGTLISAYFLYLLWSEKGTMVFSDEYKKVLEETPHIVYRTSIIVKIFVGLLLLVLGLAIVGAIAAALTAV